MLAPAGGKLPGTTIPKVLEGAVNPFKRALLFRPRLVLYVNRPEWVSAFQSPRYTVVLGRSQDLFTYTSVKVIELVKSDEAYFENTLAPYRVAMQTASGYVTLMPRYLDYANNRQPNFARYVVVNRRVPKLMRFEGQKIESDFWIDPESPEVNGTRLGLWFHTFVGDYDDAPQMA